MASAGFGEHLRREREMRGVSLDEIAGATRISTRFLEALEKEAWDRLPGGVFNRGFVRTVARFLGLEEESLLAEYSLAKGEGNPPPPVSAELPVQQPSASGRNVSWTDARRDSRGAGSCRRWLVRLAMDCRPSGGAERRRQFAASLAATAGRATQRVARRAESLQQQPSRVPQALREPVVRSDERVATEASKRPGTRR